MRYSSRKLSTDKVITTACNFWGQISCSFQVMSENILFWGKKIFEIAPFFQTRPGDLGKKVHACSLRFSALNIWSTLLPVKFVLRSVFSIGDNLPVNLGKTIAQESIKSTCCWQALLKNAIAPNVTLRCQFHKIQHGEKFDHLKNRKSHVLHLAGRMLICRASSTTMIVHKISF